MSQKGDNTEIELNKRTGKREGEREGKTCTTM